MEPHIFGDQLNEQLDKTMEKLSASDDVYDHLVEKYNAAYDTSRLLARRHSSSTNSLLDRRQTCNVANNPIAVRLTVLSTHIHVLRRYQLVLLREIMRMHHALRRHVSPQLWATWYNREGQMSQQAPNVHNQFLLTHDDNRFLHPTIRDTLWRPSQ